MKGRSGRIASLPSPHRKREADQQRHGIIKKRLLFLPPLGRIILFMFLIMFGISFLVLYRGVNKIPIKEELMPNIRSSQKIKLSGCGAAWKDFVPRVDKKIFNDIDNPFIWTVSGGGAYRAYLKFVLNKWKSLGMFPVMVLALDAETADHVCQLGFFSVLWDEPKASYSLVADAKFGAAADLADHGIHALFLEPDVFCRVSPLPLLKKEVYESAFVPEILYPGHGDVACNPNIGLYYVRPSAVTAGFFRSLRDVLAYSLTEKVFVTGNNRTKAYFDQDVFYHCLPRTNERDIYYSDPIKNFEMFRMDSDERFDLLDLCRNETSPQFLHNFVSHVYINAHNPPSVFDSTMCIHPLSDSPFSSITHKLATAKFLGFDPVPVIPPTSSHGVVGDRFLLKTLSGDITFNECWGFAFQQKEFLRPTDLGAETIEFVIAELVALANLTKRTLVIPRYLRDKNSWAIPIMSVVDVSTIAPLVPSWRFLSPDELHALSPPEKLPPIVDTGTDFDELLHGVRAHHKAPVVAIQDFCRLGEGKTASKNQVVQEIHSHLKFCFADRRAVFVRSIGSWSRLCGT